MVFHYGIHRVEQRYATTVTHSVRVRRARYVYTVARWDGLWLV